MSMCGNAEETVEHYILTCEKLEKFRNPKSSLTVQS